MKNLSLKVLSLLLALISLFSLAACTGNGEGEPTEAPVESTTEAPETTAPVPEETPILIADLEKYALVRPEKVTSGLLEMMNLLNQKLKDINSGISYKDDFYREDVPMYQIGEYEILVGNTNREETKTFLAGLRYQDYGYARIGNKIVIAGHSEEATENAISKFLNSVLRAKDKPEGVFYSSEYDFVKKLEYNVNTILLDNTAIENYRIVYPKNNNSCKAAAQMIANAVADASGLVIEVVHDGEEARDFEILVGATNRNTDAEIKAMTDKLGATEAVIKYDGKKINIFGVTPTAILVAANEFRANFIDAKTDKLEVTLAPELVCKYDDNVLKAMSFNVWVSGKTVERNERVLTMVRNYLPDTIGFQEVDPVWLATLREGLKDQYAYVGEGRNGGNSGEYNPIFYKKDLFNLLDSGTKWLSETPDVAASKYSQSSLPRIYTYALLERKSDGKKIMIVNTHFDHTSAEARELQAKVLVKYLKTISDYPIVLTGDFNCADNSTAFSTIIAGGMQNSYKIADKKLNNSATFTSYGSSNKIIDFAFVSPGSVAVSSYKVCDEMINNDYPSDHHPVLIEYTVIN